MFISQVGRETQRNKIMHSYETPFTFRKCQIKITAGIIFITNNPWATKEFFE